VCTADRSGGSVTVNGGGTLSLNNVGGVPGLTKAGVGTLVLTGSASYAGPTAVNAGTALVDGTLDASGGTVTVAPGSALGGAGTIHRAVTVAAGGILAPGASPGILSVNAPITLNPGSVFAVELNGPTPGNAPTNHDQLVMLGGNAIDLAGATLLPAVGGGYDPSLAGDSLTLISGGYSGTFGNGPALTVGGFPATILYQAGGVVLQFTPVPEASHVLLACGGAAGLVRWGRRRK
jgi:autotransporter-associated beta strand protein